MGINLQKGQKINLTKDGKGLSRLMVGLGWDEAQNTPQQGGGGFFGFFKSKPQPVQDIDCDASAILCNDQGKCIGMVYYQNLQLKDGSIVHQGDNLTGGGEGDDEQIMVDLSKVSPAISKIVFVVNIYQASTRNQHFGMIQNAFIRLVDLSKNVEICRYNLSENYSGMEGLIVAEIYKRDNEWKFNAIGQPLRNASYISDIKAMYK